MPVFAPPTHGHLLIPGVLPGDLEGPSSHPAPGGPRRGLPVGVRLVDHQQHLGLPGSGGRGRVHQAGGGGRLLHGLRQRAEEAAAHRRRRCGLRRGLRCRRLGGRWPALGSGRGGRGGRRCRSGTGARGGRGLLRLRALKVSHVAIGQVGNEAAVRQPAPQEVHHLA